MKKIILIILLFIIFSCTSQKPKETIILEKKESKKIVRIGCLSFIIPDNMEESPEDAKRYRYAKLIVDKNKNLYNSEKFIAIIDKKNAFNDSLISFAKQDQAYFKNSVSVIYDDAIWEPVGFKEKNINYIAYQFKYTYDGVDIFYQRSVYIECSDTFYIISLTSTIKNNILDIINDYFWENISIIP